MNVKPKESSSNYAGVVKAGGATSTRSEVSAPAPVTSQRQEPTGSQRSNSKPQQQSSVPAPEVDEFANLCKQLQAADSDSNSNPATPERSRTVQAVDVSRIEKEAMQTDSVDVPLKPKGVIELAVNEEDRMSPRTYAKVKQ